jgi:hypothetical protein
MSNTLAILALFFPLLFTLAVWAAITAWRILNDEPAPVILAEHEPEMRAIQRAEGRPVRVGVREIRADLRYNARQSASVAYDSSAPNHSFPDAWWADVCARCN